MAIERKWDQKNGTCFQLNSYPITRGAAPLLCCCLTTRAQNFIMWIAAKIVPTQKSFDQKEELTSAECAVCMEWTDQVEASSCSQEWVSLSAPAPATWTLLAKKITARSCISSICVSLLLLLCFIRITAWSPIGHLMSGPALPVCCGLVVSGKQIVDEGLYILKLAKHHLHVCHSHTKLDGQLDSMDRWTLSQQISLVLVPVLMSANYPRLPRH